ncbi:MAG TPA: FHA domain-containing protein [Tepidisphaeraceae bacterium]|jgi:hypothetical protein|nr:FHA domain-containing protein [Tepidisphaeraceae bacterium]
MPLPIELNHVLGRRSMTLAYRDVDSPITVGRSRDCDVQIPSITVGIRHCMLFVHEGYWLLQESPNAIVTVNGKPIAGPVALQIGDVIGIGPGEKAPSIQIDPAAAAAGQAGPAVETAPPPAPSESARPTAIAAATDRPIPPPKPMPISGQAPRQFSVAKARPADVPLDEPPAPENEPLSEPDEYIHADETPAFEHAEPDGDTIDFRLHPAAATSSTYRRRRPKPSSGAGGMIALFAVVLLGVGGLIWWAWNRHEAMLATVGPDGRPPAEAIVTQPTGQPKTIAGDSASTSRTMGNGGQSVGIGNSIFDVLHPKTAPGRARAPGTPPSFSPAAPPAIAPAGAQSPSTAPAAPDAASTDSDNSDPDWQSIRIAHIGPDQAYALVKYDSYRHEDPGKHTKELARFENDAIEQLWWQRVLDLFNRRAELDTQIDKQKQDLAQQPEDNFKKQMRADLADMQHKRETIDQELTGKYNYTLPTPPDLDDSDALAQLDAKRDPDKFAKWKTSTLIWIREHNGQTPWGDQ